MLGWKTRLRNVGVSSLGRNRRRRGKRRGEPKQHRKLTLHHLGIQNHNLQNHKLKLHHLGLQNRNLQNQKLKLHHLRLQNRNLQNQKLELHHLGPQNQKLRLRHATGDRTFSTI